MILASRVLVGLSAAVGVSWWALMVVMLPRMGAVVGNEGTTVVAIASVALVQVLGIACIVAASVRAAKSSPSTLPQVLLVTTSTLHLLGSLLFSFTPAVGVPVQVIAALATTLVFVLPQSHPLPSP